MKSFFDKILLRSNNLDYISKKIINLTQDTPSHKIFEAINSYSLDSEVRYVGGCIRKIINRQKVDDIDLATNLKPNEVCDALKKHNINYYESGIEHGTISAVIDKYKFEITTLREDVFTDGRHAKVKFSKNWKYDSIRRDFTFNSIYSDKDGNLFAPHDGKKDLENGFVNFIGNPDTRIKEDYLRILRYLRFFLNYSKVPHNSQVIKTLRMNIGGILKLSKERLLDELKKLIKIEILEKLSKDKYSSELILMIFPELKNIKLFSKLNSYSKELVKENDFIFLLSLIIIDETDNAEYFLYRFNLSKKDEKRLKIIDNFYKEKNNPKILKENNINKFFYYNGKQAVLDILNYKIVNSKKIDENLIKLKKNFEKKTIPIMPINASLLMEKYNIPKGKKLGDKLKSIELIWVENNFEISDHQIDKIVNN